MAQTFYIRKGATLPTLRIELIMDGRYDFLKSYNFNNAIQNADIAFSMKRMSDGKKKIINKPAIIVKSEQSSCEERYIIEYQWTEHDTLEEGEFIGEFTINFKDDLYEKDNSYQGGILLSPISEILNIIIH
jgi:hypothetical protein